jgi:uroporphyrinogen III methyltransferase/synthase
VSWGTTGQQQSVAGTLADIADLAEKKDLPTPAITVIGDVVKLRGALNWFEHRPLFGQRVVVTRARDQAGGLAHDLAELGADVLEIPTIKIAPPEDRQLFVEVLNSIGEYDWLVFTSANGVTSFFDYFFRAYEDVRDLGAVRLAAVGPGTAAKLQELRLKVDVMPQEALGRTVADALSTFQSIENVKILLLRAAGANPDLPKALEEKGAIVDDVPCYQTVPDTEDRNGAAARLRESGADWITFTSGSTVRNFHARFDLLKLTARFPRLKLASLGPETSKAITALGLQPAVEAREHTVDGLVKAIRQSGKTK